MKFFKKLFGRDGNEAEVQKLVETFTKPKQKTGIEIEISAGQFQKLKDYERIRTSEEKATLAAALALRLQRAIKLEDVNLYNDVEAEAKAYFKGWDIFWYHEATNIKQAEQDISKEALALRVLEWSKREGKS